MTAKAGIPRANITIGQLKRLCELGEIEGGHVNRVTLEAYMNRQEPFPFPYSRHGHPIVTVTGRSRTGKMENVYLTSRGHFLSPVAMRCLDKGDEYNVHHRLEEGKSYRVVLMPGRVIKHDETRVPKHLRGWAEAHGYGAPLPAGVVLRLLELISVEQMIALGMTSITSLHEPIGGSLLTVGLEDGYARPMLGTECARPETTWSGNAGFAFAAELEAEV